MFWLWYLVNSVKWFMDLNLRTTYTLLQTCLCHVDYSSDTHMLMLHSLSDICDMKKTEFASFVDSYQHRMESTEMFPEINLHNADARRRRTELDQTIASICTNVPNYCPCCYRIFYLCIDHSSSHCVHWLLSRGFTLCYNNIGISCSFQIQSRLA